MSYALDIESLGGYDTSGNFDPVIRAGDMIGRGISDAWNYAANHPGDVGRTLGGIIGGAIAGFYGGGSPAAIGLGTALGTLLGGMIGDRIGGASWGDAFLHNLPPAIAAGLGAGLGGKFLGPILENFLKGGLAGFLGRGAGKFFGGLLEKWLFPDNPLHPQRRDPLVFDLDGDGIELIGVNASHANFDFDGDGFRERTGWVKSDDGILVRDRNGNGKIDDGSELFGTAQEQGFDVLKKLDSNSDGRIDANDEAFSSLRIWRDLNGDGQSSADELFTLQQLGITSIGLSNEAVNINQDGNVIAYQGSYSPPARNRVISGARIVSQSYRTNFRFFENTVGNHMRAIFQRLSLRRRSELANLSQ